MNHGLIFSSIADAVNHAKQHGGWIARTSTLVYWLDASYWTLSRILAELPKVNEIGTHTTNWGKECQR